VMGRVTGVGEGLPTQLRVPDFPNGETRIRAFAINIHGESDPSQELTIPPVPSAPQGLRYTITLSAVSIHQPGRRISIEQSDDLTTWHPIASGWTHVVVSVPRHLPRAFFRARFTPA
jgi:hypothetical protein